MSVPEPAARPGRQSTNRSPAADRLSHSTWHTSSRSQTSNCVEVTLLSGNGVRVAMRDSKDPCGPVLVFDRPQWLAFIARARRNRFGVELSDCGRRAAHPTDSPISSA